MPPSLVALASDASREVGLHQVEASDDEAARLHPPPCPNRLSRGGDRRFLSRAMDPVDDHLVRPYVPFLPSLPPPPTNLALLGAASFTIYSRTKEYYRDRDWLSRNRIFDVSAVGGIRFESRRPSSAFPGSDIHCRATVVPSLDPLSHLGARVRCFCSFLCIYDSPPSTAFELVKVRDSATLQARFSEPRAPLGQEAVGILHRG